jgi:phosphate transport system substrate-binding protein
VTIASITASSRDKDKDRDQHRVKVFSKEFRVKAALLLACAWMCSAVSLEAQQKVVLVGSGTTLASHLLGIWGKEFARTHSGIAVAYVATSSGDGVRQLNLLQEDFAIGEIPLTMKQRNNGDGLRQIPIALISIVPIYNLPGRPDLRFTGELLAQMYMGLISNWNDERIAKLNPGLQLPNRPIMLLQRPEETGSHYAFTEFLAKTSPEFRNWMRNGRPHRPSEVIKVLSQNMADTVMSTPGSIGYVNVGIAVQLGLPYGLVQNSAKKFVKASPLSIGAAAAAMGEMVFARSDSPLLDAPGKNSYPLTSFVWAYVPLTSATPQRTDNLYMFLDWCLGEGQDLVEGHGYDRLPDTISSRAEKNLQTQLK